MRQSILEWGAVICSETLVASGIEPSRRLLRPSVDDRIRGFGYSAQIAAALIALCDRKGMREGERPTDGGFFFAYRECPARGRGKQLVRIDLPMDGKSVHLKFARGLLTDFSGTFPGIRLRLGKRGIPNNCRLTTSDSSVPELLSLLEWLTTYLNSRRGKRS